jgi:hypothetical protein
MNHTEYSLTAGVYTRNPPALDASFLKSTRQACSSTLATA